MFACSPSIASWRIDLASPSAAPPPSRRSRSAALQRVSVPRPLALLPAATTSAPDEDDEDDDEEDDNEASDDATAGSWWTWAWEAARQATAVSSGPSDGMHFW